MYPILRLCKEMIKFRNHPKLKISDTHVSSHMCWPVDIDVFGEMNNGRILTVYDLGRLVMGQRMGLIKALKENGWGLTMAGASVRYRQRVRLFQKFTMHSRAVGYDDRFMYLTQTMWSKGHATSSILYRAAVTDKNGIVPTEQILKAMGVTQWNPVLPEWVQNWIDAEGTRTWPPDV